MSPSLLSPPPEPGPYLALDWGGRKVGYATSDEEGLVITPRGTFFRKNPRGADVWSLFETDRLILTKLLKSYEPGSLILGLPLNADHTESPGSLGARALQQQLTQWCQLPVILVPEMLTSWASRGASDEDAEAAALLLSDYFQERARQAKLESL